MSGPKLLSKANRQQASQLDSFISDGQLKSAKLLILQIFSQNQKDYSEDYLNSTRVSNFISWAEKNDTVLTKKINKSFEANKHIFAALSSAITGHIEGRDISPELLFIFEQTNLPATDKNLTTFAFEIEKLQKNSYIALVGVVLGQEYIQSQYSKTKDPNPPMVLFFSEDRDSKYYPQANAIGISLFSLIDENLRGSLDDTSLLISTIDTGIHEGTHGLAIANNSSEDSLGELATYIAAENYALPVKSDYLFELWNMPILNREKESNNLGSKNPKIKNADLKQSFYLIQFMGPWIHSYLKESGDVNIEQFRVNSEDREINVNELYQYHKSGALDEDSVKLEAQAFCENSGIRNQDLISKITNVFTRFHQIMGAQGIKTPNVIGALIQALDEVFTKPKIPNDVLDGYAKIQKTNSKNSRA